MIETWKKINGYYGLYEVSNLGRVKSVDKLQIMRNGVKRNRKGKILKEGKFPNGYKFAILSKNGFKTNKLIHRLVAEAFLEKPNGKDYVNHKNLIRSDNRVENLEWVTASENILHARTVGTAKFCYIEKETKVIDLATNEIIVFKNQKLVCDFFGKSKCWINNKYRQCGKPFIFKGYKIGVN